MFSTGEVQQRPIWKMDGAASAINLSENAIRSFATGRKNWLFSNSVEGANASAVAYTMARWPKHTI